jgi:outer membrane protein insertion porin family
MVRRILLVVSWLVFFPTAVMAQGEVRVLILPFKVHAVQSMDSLQEQIPHLVSQQLTEDGVTVVEPPGPGEARIEAVDEPGFRHFRSLGSAVAADFVIWGSFTLVGQRYSLDGKVLDTYGEAAPQAVFMEGEGVETMLDSVRKLARDIGMKILGLEKVADVVISGNKRIESEAIKRIVKTKKGDLYLKRYIRDDVKSIFKMGYFGDVRVEVAESTEGKVVTFFVAEKDTVRHIRIRGNDKFDDEKIKEVLNTKTGAILNFNTLKSDMEEIRALYKDKGYHNANVTYELEPSSENESNVEFIITEGDKIFVKAISFEGNKAFDDDDLKDLMKTTEKGFFSWITSSGDLDREALEQDMSRIGAYYHNHGYIQARVGDPELRYEDNSIFISVKVEEGVQFKVGKVAIEGDLIRPEEELFARIKIAADQVFNREVIREDILMLTDMYSDEGYAYADISPRIDHRVEEHEADITYVIDKGKQAYFEKIIIAGNTKTRDKVIRRQLSIYEQELFSGRRLKRGTRNLYRLDYFEDIKVNTTQGSAPDKMIVNIDVTEKSTGAFSFGGGYSNVDNLFFMASVNQRNLFGRGQTLGLRAQIGARTTDFTFSFTEPWLFDIPLSAGFDIYNTSKDYDTYDKDSKGLTLRAGYPVYDYTRAFVSYNYDRATIENLTTDASSSIREFEGTNTGHTLGGTLRRDTRDQAFNPTEGSDNSLTVKHAGWPFGGDIGFTKYVGDSGWYFPLFWSTVGFLHGRTGFIGGDSGDSDSKVPTWERFYLGGMNSVRGYDWREISPRDPVTDDKIGGNKMVLFNVEFLFPLIKNAGIRGVLFFDTGNVFDNGEDLSLSDLKESVGYGIRWLSPMGPIRLEYGYILDSERKGEGGWEFSMGAAF